MNVIGQGAQYRVTDAEDGRVRKIPLTRQESQSVIKSWYTPNHAPKEELMADYRQVLIDSATYIQILTARHPETMYSFGNPLFEKDGQYTQDKVTVLGAALSHNSLHEGKDLIDKYVSLILLHWTYGFSEQVFNFTINNGIDNAGRVILIDFGEITNDKEKVISHVTSERWLKSWSYNSDLFKELKKYYRLAMRKHLSIKVLEATWMSAI